MRTAALSTLALVAMLAAATTPQPFAQDAVPSIEQERADLMAIGEPIYLARCKECHGSAGGGFIGPKFVGNDRIANDELVVRQITGGSADMPSFRSKLTPQEIRAVASYIRNSWGNDYGILPD